MNFVASPHLPQSYWSLEIRITPLADLDYGAAYEQFKNSVVNAVYVQANDLVRCLRKICLGVFNVKNDLFALHTKRQSWSAKQQKLNESLSLWDDRIRLVVWRGLQSEIVDWHHRTRFGAYVRILNHTQCKSTAWAHILLAYYFFCDEQHSRLGGLAFKKEGIQLIPGGRNMMIPPLSYTMLSVLFRESAILRSQACPEVPPILFHLIGIAQSYLTHLFNKILLLAFG